MALRHQLTSRQNLLSNISRVLQKGPAFAGLFFVFITAAGGYPHGRPKLSPSGQQYFRAFLEAFTPLVLKREKKGGNVRWGEKNRDCAGLVRYLFWETMQPHAEAFYDSYPEARGVRTGDMREFRGVESSWTAGNFTAAGLIAQSLYLGRNTETLRLKSGDLLYFQSTELKIRHVMLVIRTGRDIFLVYHTGDARGELRIRTFADIGSLPESEWHPDVSNPVFRGVYRPQFLD